MSWGIRRQLVFPSSPFCTDRLLILLSSRC